MESLISVFVRIVMGILGGQLVGMFHGQPETEQTVRIVAGAVGGFGLGFLLGEFLADDGSFIALLGYAGAGFIGGALATAIVVPAQRGR